jgi:hypothetical protein
VIDLFRQDPFVHLIAPAIALGLYCGGQTSKNNRQSGGFQKIPTIHEEVPLVINTRRTVAETQCA